MNCLVLLLALSLLYGCGAVNKGNTPGTQSSTKSSTQSPSIVIAAATAQIRVGDTQQFLLRVSGLPAGNVGGANPGVTWSVNSIPGGNATAGTIDAKGLYTAPAALPNPNSVNVTATSAAVPSISATTPLTLYNPIPVVTSVSPTTVSVGGFTLTVIGKGFAKGAQVLFAGTVLQTAFNSATQLTATGIATQAQVGNMQILVKNPDPGSATSTAGLNVQVTLAPPIRVLVSPSKTTLEAGQVQQFTATVQGTSNSGVIWSVNGVSGGNAILGTISPNGRYMTPATLPNPNSVTVTATSAANTGSSGAAVIVLQASAPATKTTNYYVNAETGLDSYDGTTPMHTGGNVGPWLTLRKAGLTASAGATVHVADGTYKVNGTIGSATSIETRHSGTANAWITYVSDNKWGAKIVNTNSVNGPNNIAWVVEGDYQIVKDFDISGGPYTGIFVDGNHVQLIGNHLHDISSASCVGGSFIYVNSPYHYVDTIGNVMHDGGMKPWPSDCGHWHGIYYGGVTNGPVQYGQISNNIIYRVSGWGIHFWHKVSHIDVLNNLIFSNVHGGILIGASDDSTNDYLNVNNNIVIYNSNMLDNAGGPGSLGWGISEYVSDGSTVGPHNSYLNNLVYENRASNGWGGNWANQAVGTNPTGVISDTVTANPLLTNYRNSPAVPAISYGKVVFSGADYHPTPISPAKNGGDCMSTPRTDTDGAARPQGEACDIGPY